MNVKKIIIGSDHAGYDLKTVLIEYLKENHYKVEDIGCFSKESVDYPIIAKKLAGKVIQCEDKKGILICGTGIGMNITANKTKGIRAVVCSDTTSAKYSRLHNDSNVLCLGARIVGEYLAKDICDIWLKTSFEGDRHLRRVTLIEN